MRRPAVDGAVPREVRIAVVIIGLQALGLLVAAAVLTVKTITSPSDSLGRALLDIAFAAVGVAVLTLAARSLLSLSPSARTPVIVLELLALPVGYSLGFQAGRMLFGAPIMVSGLAVLYLLFTPPARTALDRQI